MILMKCRKCLRELTDYDESGKVYCEHCGKEWKYDVDLLPREGVLELAEGKYEGLILKNRPFGTGKLTLHSGEVYEGEWNEGKMTGKGTLTSTDSVYEGYFENGLPSGEGILRVLGLLHFSVALAPKT